MEYLIRKSKTGSGFELKSGNVKPKPGEGWKSFSSNAAREQYRLNELNKKKK